LCVDGEREDGGKWSVLGFFLGVVEEKKSVRVRLLDMISCDAGSYDLAGACFSHALQHKNTDQEDRHL